MSLGDRPSIRQVEGSIPEALSGMHGDFGGGLSNLFAARAEDPGSTYDNGYGVSAAENIERFRQFVTALAEQRKPDIFDPATTEANLGEFLRRVTAANDQERPAAREQADRALGRRDVPDFVHGPQDPGLPGYGFRGGADAGAQRGQMVNPIERYIDYVNGDDGAEPLRGGKTRSTPEATSAKAQNARYNDTSGDGMGIADMVRAVGLAAERYRRLGADPRNPTSWRNGQVGGGWDRRGIVDNNGPQAKTKTQQSPFGYDRYPLDDPEIWLDPASIVKNWTQERDFARRAGFGL